MAFRPAALLLLLLCCRLPRSAAQSFEEQLLRDGLDSVAEASVRNGDARRGAAVFYQPALACSRCHAQSGVSGADPEVSLGPDLTGLGAEATARHVVESILEPSESIRPQHRTAVIQTADGRNLAGIVVAESSEALSLRSAADGRLLQIPQREIAERASSPLSLMPVGQVNQLASRQQFLDLVKYVVEIGRGGPDRARQLQPPPQLLASALPEYELRLDHRRLIESLDEESRQRGEAIYQRRCANCHGTLDQPGSLPTSRKFAREALKNGASPYALYQTLSRGFGLMPPQTGLVPKQKYDVIHYLRESYLRPHNPGQYAPITAAELAALPLGDTLGPDPSGVEPWRQMNYGQTLINTYEFGDDGANFAHKGIAVRLNPGEGGVSQGSAWLVFDHDTLRVAGVWTGAGFIDWRGIHFDGEHQVHPRAVGRLIAANPTGPGWCEPNAGTRADPRILGRDGRRYGPLPREWAHYRGLYRYADRAVMDYTVGATRILESPQLIESAAGANVAADAVSEPPIVARVMNIGQRSQALELLAATEADAQFEFTTLTVIQSPQIPSRLDGALGRTRSALAQSGPPTATPVRIAVLSSRRRTATGRRTPTETAAPRSSLVAAEGPLIVGISPAVQGVAWRRVGDELRLQLPAGPPLQLVLWMVRGTKQPDLAQKASLASRLEQGALAIDLAPFTRGGPPAWRETLTTFAQPGDDQGPLAVDVLEHPAENPWFAQMRFTGLDFFPDGDRAALCAWDGDVWLVSGLQRLSGGLPGGAVELSWRRIAAGLFQPLGVRIVRDEIYVSCRDQIVILRDLNGDGETDFYQNFNNDHQVTEHFHEFAMGLQTDSQGNFYYAKSARHALPAVVPHHGTLLKVSPDGSRTEILATGFRAANGVCLNPDGSFVVTDQEGHWNPKNRINWVVPGRFYGNMFGYHDVTDDSDSAMEQPLAWITNAFDRSPAELLWVDSDRWRPLAGSLLNLSYGYGRMYVVPFETVNGTRQGGMCQLPLPDFPTGVLRGRFHPTDGQLYLCGMVAWASSVTQPGGFYRVRLTGRPLHAPCELHARSSGLEIAFTDPLDPDSAKNPANYDLHSWSLHRSANYGSDHINPRGLSVRDAHLSTDGRRLTLEIEGFGPTQCFELVCRLRTLAGDSVVRTIHGTVHALGE